MPDDTYFNPFTHYNIKDEVDLLAGMVIYCQEDNATRQQIIDELDEDQINDLFDALISLAILRLEAADTIDALIPPKCLIDVGNRIAKVVGIDPFEDEE